MGKDKLKVPEAVKAIKPKNTGVPVHGLYGIMLLIVCASIIYANYRVFFGVEELLPRIMLIPSTGAVVAFLVYKAAK